MGGEGRKEWGGKGEYASLDLGGWTPLAVMSGNIKHRPKLTKMKNIKICYPPDVEIMSII